jgi:DNA-binding NtrC family response regulator
MSAAAVRILVVGTSTTSTESTLKGLARSGWESHAVKTVREADTVLRTIRFQLVLATEKLPDGTGYDLAWLVAQQTGNLFIAVPLSETCLWLPAVENGVRALGERALNPLILKTEAESILRTCDTGMVSAESERGQRRSSSGEVVRAEAAASEAAGQIATGKRFGQQPHERFEHGKDLVPRGRSAADEEVLALVGKAPSHSSRLLHGSAIRDFGSLGKRRRSL